METRWLKQVLKGVFQEGGEKLKPLTRRPRRGNSGESKSWAWRAFTAGSRRGRASVETRWLKQLLKMEASWLKQMLKMQVPKSGSTVETRWLKLWSLGSRH